MLTVTALESLPLGYEVTADDIAALSGQNRIKGIHPLLDHDPRSVVILCTIWGGDYPDRWLDDGHNELIYCLEGRFSAAEQRKVYNPKIRANRAVARSAAEGYPVHVFWRPRKRMPFTYAGKYVFLGYDDSIKDHVAFHLARIAESPSYVSSTMVSE